jgi:hypothetical protein
MARENENSIAPSQERAGNAELLRKARERTQAELLKKAVDMSTGSKGAALTALAAAVLIPAADASGLLDLLADATDIPAPEAVQAGQRRRRRY